MEVTDDVTKLCFTRGRDRTADHSTPEPLYGGTGTGRRITVRDIAAAKARGEKWPMLTAYDALTAGIFDRAGIPVLLVGDSAAMVVYGHDTTIPVTVDDLIPLTAAVVRGTSRALVVADLPFGSYQASPGAALAAATRFLKETGAHAVKLEGGQRVAHQVEELVAAGIPVMAHLGLTPQSVNAFGGYRVQGRGEDGERLLHDAKVLEAAGAFSVVLECVPASLAAAGDRGPDHPHHRHRGRPGLRRPGAGLAGHGGPVPADGEVRQEVRRPGRHPRRGRDRVRRGRHLGCLSRTRSTPTAEALALGRALQALPRPGHELDLEAIGVGQVGSVVIRSARVRVRLGEQQRPAAGRARGGQGVDGLAAGPRGTPGGSAPGRSRSWSLAVSAGDCSTTRYVPPRRQLQPSSQSWNGSVAQLARAASPTARRARVRSGTHSST